MHRCFIFGALPVESINLFPEKDDYIIAADKGYENLLKLNIKPDIVIGDFDSSESEPDIENKIKLEVRKDDTDVEHAVKYALKKGYKDFVFYGCVGGLLDHTIANIQIASFIADNNGKSIFYGKENFTVIKNDVITFSEKDKGRISVFSLSDYSNGVNIKNLSYEAEDLILKRDVPMGVSNSFIGKEASISVEDGELLIIWENKEQIIEKIIYY